MTNMHDSPRYGTSGFRRHALLYKDAVIFSTRKLRFQWNCYSPGVTTQNVCRPRSNRTENKKQKQKHEEKNSEVLNRCGLHYRSVGDVSE